MQALLQQQSHEEELARLQQLNVRASREIVNQEEVLRSSISQLQAQLLQAQTLGHNQCPPPSRPRCRQPKFIFWLTTHSSHPFVQRWKLQQKICKSKLCRPNYASKLTRSRQPPRGWPECVNTRASADFSRSSRVCLAAFR